MAPLMAISPGGRPADDSPLGPGNLWKTPGLKLPRYLRMIANALLRKGMPRGEAIATAKNTLERLAEGHTAQGAKVHPQVRAAAAAALAEWEADRARAHGSK